MNCQTKAGERCNTWTTQEHNWNQDKSKIRLRAPPNVMPIVGELSHMIPSHFVRVGQSIRVDPVQETAIQRSPSSMEPTDAFSDPELDEALDNLNHLILELDPTFEPIQTSHSPTFPSLHTDDSSPDEDVSHCVLVPRGCSPSPSSTSRSIPISPYIGPSCSPHGSLVFSGSPSSSRPPLPCGIVHRRSPSTRNEIPSPRGSLRTSSNRNSAISLLSTSPGSDTSYMIGSCLSLTSDDGDSPESLLSRASGSFSNMSTSRPFDTKHSPDKPSPTKRFQGLHCNGNHSSPASLSGSLTDIPILLVNGTTEPHCQSPLGPDAIIQAIHMPHSSPSSHHSFQAPFHGSQPSMKFVMDTSKSWFRPHINRAEAEALVKDKEPGSFIVRDSTSYRGCFGLAMRVQQVPANLSPTNRQGESSSDLVRHFLIESSPKGVRIKGSSQEPYFGSLSALVYQHTITAYALPCKLLLQSHDLGAREERTDDTTASEDKTKTASNFLYLNAVPTEMLTGPCAVEKAVSSTLQKDSKAITPTVVNLKVSSKGVTLTDIQRKLFFRRHYPAHLLSYSGEDPEKRQWLNGSGGSRIFGIVAKGTEAGMENVCHVFAEYDPLQPCTHTIELIESAKP